VREWCGPGRPDGGLTWPDGPGQAGRRVGSPAPEGAGAGPVSRPEAGTTGARGPEVTGEGG
ncbi:MAG: hypothetical protein ACRDPY_30565, partial [Streptosporangiaceae bacterium]